MKGSECVKWSVCVCVCVCVCERGSELVKHYIYNFGCIDDNRPL